MLNENCMPNYLKTSRLIMFSKTNKTSAKLKRYARPNAVLSQLMKVLEQAIKINSSKMRVKSSILERTKKV